MMNVRYVVQCVSAIICGDMLSNNVSNNTVGCIIWSVCSIGYVLAKSTKGLFYFIEIKLMCYHKTVDYTINNLCTYYVFIYVRHRSMDQSLFCTTKSVFVDVNDSISAMHSRRFFCLLLSL